jgi:hypothetical protein
MINASSPSDRTLNPDVGVGRLHTVPTPEMHDLEYGGCDEQRPVFDGQAMKSTPATMDSYHSNAPNTVAA